MKILSILLLLATPVLAQRPLGTFALGPPVTGPTGFVTNSFKVELPDVPFTPAGGRGQIAVARPSGTPVAVDVHFSGHGGTRWWTWSGNTLEDDKYIASLLAANHIVVQVIWMGNGWFAAQAGHPDGMARLAGRPATAMQWIYDNIALIHDTGATSHRIPLNLIGISGGSAQIAYSLAFYGIWAVANTAIMISGPPFDEQCRGCLGDYDESERQMIDASTGYYKLTGPCHFANSSWCDFWNQSSVTPDGGRYTYPNTRTILVTGGRDSQDILSRAFHYRDYLLSHSEPIEHFIVPTMGHPLNAQGFALLQSLLQ